MMNGKRSQNAEYFLELECEPLYESLRAKLSATQREVARMVYRRIEFMAYRGDFRGARQHLSELHEMDRVAA